jgi:hypothetical protein
MNMSKCHRDVRSLSLANVSLFQLYFLKEIKAKLNWREECFGFFDNQGLQLILARM